MVCKFKAYPFFAKPKNDSPDFSVCRFSHRLSLRTSSGFLPGYSCAWSYIRPAKERGVFSQVRWSRNPIFSWTRGEATLRRDPHQGLSRTQTNCRHPLLPIFSRPIFECAASSPPFEDLIRFFQSNDCRMSSAIYRLRKTKKARMALDTSGAPERIRTADPKLRRLVLYPAELRAQEDGALDGSRTHTGRPTSS